MKAKTLFLSALLAASDLVVAAPAPAPSAPARFQLRTVVTAGNTNKNGLYVEGYHTGAGTADATLSSTKPTNQAIFLNDTAIQFDYDTDYSTYLNMRYDTNYASWDDVSVNSIYGPTPGFYFNNTAAKVDALGIGLKWNPDYPYAAPPNNASGEFGGWYACDWYHNVPQLFWIQRYEGSNNSRIDTCSKVELERVAA